MSRPTILLAEGISVRHGNFRQQMERCGFEVLEAGSRAEVLGILREATPDLVILGSSQDGDWEAADLARQIHKTRRHLPLILIATNSSEDLAIAALRAGVSDYFRPPFVCEELVASIRRCLAAACDKDAGPVRSADAVPAMVGKSPQMQAMRTYLEKAAATDSNVLITGETGTGKELVAQMIHEHSLRHGKPIVCINCAALPDSLLESELFGHERGAFTGAQSAYPGKLRLAEGGTVLFDEIGDMSSYAQAKILRAIESKEVYPVGGRRGIRTDLRVVAATNQDLEGLMTRQLFRNDLYFRLNVARIRLPPLRERREDIPLLFNHYLAELRRRTGRPIPRLSEQALDCLLRYDWPGNVRELRNLVEALFIGSPPGTISVEDLPESWRGACRAAQEARMDERERLLAVLTSTRWNKSQAAQKLHCSRMTLYRKIARYRIGEERPDDARAAAADTAGSDTL